MAEIASAYVSIIPSARGFGSKLNSQVSPQVGRAGTSIGAGLGKSMLKGFIAIGVGLKIAQFLGDSVSEAREANAVAAQTENVIKTTGGAAKVTASQVERLADALSKKTGIDDEQIASAENLILTFKNVVREGKGVDNIFGRASRAAVDLSAAGFGSLDSTAKQLGKALNDPVKGLASLSRAGVTFTDQQKEQIKTLVESGKGFKAQKIILREVESQVKGSAEAQATNADKARVAMGNLKETVGKALVPALDAMAGLFANKIAPAITGFIEGLQNGSGAGGRFADFFNNRVRPVLDGVVGFVRDVVIPAFRDALPKALDGLKAGFNKVKKAVEDNKPELQQLFDVAKKIATFFYERLMPAVYELAGNALKRLGTVIGVVIDVVGFMVRAFNRAKDIFGRVRDAIGFIIDKFKDLVSAIRTKVGDVVSDIKRIGSEGFQPIREGAAFVKEVVVGVFVAISSAIQGAIDKAAALISKLKEAASMGHGSAVKGSSRTATGTTGVPSGVKGYTPRLDLRGDIGGAGLHGEVRGLRGDVQRLASQIGAAVGSEVNGAAANGRRRAA